MERLTRILEECKIQYNINGAVSLLYCSAQPSVFSHSVIIQGTSKFLWKL